MSRYSIDNSSCEIFSCQKYDNQIECRRCGKKISQTLLKTTSEYPYQDRDDTLLTPKDVWGQCVVAGQGGGIRENLAESQVQVGLNWRQFTDKRNRQQLRHTELEKILQKRVEISWDEFEHLKLFDLSHDQYVVSKGRFFEPVACTLAQIAQRKEHEAHKYTCLECYNKKLTMLSRRGTLSKRNMDPLLLIPTQQIEYINKRTSGVMLNGNPFSVVWSRERIDKLQIHSYYYHTEDAETTVHLLSPFFVNVNKKAMRDEYTTKTLRSVESEHKNRVLVQIANMNRFAFIGNKLSDIYSAFADPRTHDIYRDTIRDDADVKKNKSFTVVNRKSNFYTQDPNYFIYGIFIKSKKLPRRMVLVHTHNGNGDMKTRRHTSRPFWVCDCIEYKLYLPPTEHLQCSTFMSPSNVYTEILGSVYMLRPENYTAKEEDNTIYVNFIQQHLRSRDGLHYYIHNGATQRTVSKRIPLLQEGTGLLYLNNVYTWADCRQHGLVHDMFASIDNTIAHNVHEFTQEFQFVYFCTKEDNPGMTMAAQRAQYSSLTLEEYGYYYPLVWWKYFPASGK